MGNEIVQKLLEIVSTITNGTNGAQNGAVLENTLFGEEPFSNNMIIDNPRPLVTEIQPLIDPEILQLPVVTSSRRSRPVREVSEHSVAISASAESGDSESDESESDEADDDQDDEFTTRKR